MSYSATVLNVMIASPGDCRDERAAVRSVVTEWNAVHAETWKTVLLPKMWERDALPSAGDPQAAIDAEIVANADVLIAMFKHTVGTTPPNGGDPGTIHEIALCAEGKKDVHVYFYSGDIPQSVDPDQLAALRAYKRDMRQELLYAEYDSVSSLTAKVNNNLSQLLARKAASGQIEVPMTNEQIRAEIQRAREEATNMAFLLGGAR